MRKLAILLTVFALSACGGGTPGATNFNVVGVYDQSRFSEQPFGVDADLTGALSTEGEILLYNFATGRVYTASVGDNGNRVEGPFRGYNRDTGSSFNVIGSKAASGSLVGIGGDPVSLVTGSYQVDGVAQAGTFTLNRQAATTFPTGMSYLVGTWSNLDSSSGYTQTLTITASAAFGGSYSGTDSNGCTYSGTLEVLTPGINVYRNIGRVECPQQTAIIGSGVLFRVLPILPGGVQEGIVLGISDANRTSVARLIKQPAS